MTRDARLNVFSATFAVTYLALFFVNEFFQFSLFGYYPVIGKFVHERLPLETSGPSILWYSWLLGAAVVGLVAALLTPRRVAERLGQNWVWMIGIALLVVVFVYERRWFY